MPKEFEPHKFREFIEREKSEHFPFHEHINHAHPHPLHHHDFQNNWGDDDDGDDNPLLQLIGFFANLFS